MTREEIDAHWQQKREREAAAAAPEEPAWTPPEWSYDETWWPPADGATVILLSRDEASQFVKSTPGWIPGIPLPAPDALIGAKPGWLRSSLGGSGFPWLHRDRDQDVHHEPMQFMSRSDVADYLGLKSARSLTGVELPPADVIIGRSKGWVQSSVDVFKAQRPGKGRPKSH